MNARLALTNPAGSLSVALFGQNLADEEIVYDASALGSRYGYPRTLGLEVTYDLGGP